MKMLKIALIQTIAPILAASSFGAMTFNVPSMGDNWTNVAAPADAPQIVDVKMTKSPEIDLSYTSPIEIDLNGDKSGARDVPADEAMEKYGVTLSPTFGDAFPEKFGTGLGVDEKTDPYSDNKSVPSRLRKNNLVLNWLKGNGVPAGNRLFILEQGFFSKAEGKKLIDTYGEEKAFHLMSMMGLTMEFDPPVNEISFERPAIRIYDAGGSWLPEWSVKVFSGSEQINKDLPGQGEGSAAAKGTRFFDGAYLTPGHRAQAKALCKALEGFKCINPNGEPPADDDAHHTHDRFNYSFRSEKPITKIVFYFNGHQQYGQYSRKPDPAQNDLGELPMYNPIGGAGLRAMPFWKIHIYRDSRLNQTSGSM